MTGAPPTGKVKNQLAGAKALVEPAQHVHRVDIPVIGVSLVSEISKYALPDTYACGSPGTSLGMRQSPRGDSPTEPTFGPSGRLERLNCCV